MAPGRRRLLLGCASDGFGIAQQGVDAKKVFDNQRMMGPNSGNGILEYGELQPDVILKVLFSRAQTSSTTPMHEQVPPMWMTTMKKNSHS